MPVSSAKTIVIVDVLLLPKHRTVLSELLQPRYQGCGPPPVIFVAAVDSMEAGLYGMESGAADCVIKFIVLSIVLARVQMRLELKEARD